MSKIIRYEIEKSPIVGSQPTSRKEVDQEPEVLVSSFSFSDRRTVLVKNELFKNLLTSS